MKRSLILLLLISCFLFAFSSTTSVQELDSTTIPDDSTIIKTKSVDDSIAILNHKIIELSEKMRENSSASGYMGTIPFVFTILISLVTAAFGYITYLANRDREETKKLLEKVENKSDLIDKGVQQREKAVLEQMDHYLDSILITFNKMLPEYARIKIELLKYVLYLRHHERRERFAAINFLGERGDETVISYLQAVATTEKDTELAGDARRAIGDIKKRIGQAQAS